MDVRVASTHNIERVLSAASSLTGHANRGLFRFCNEPIAEFDHLTAMQLVDLGKAQAVVNYIASISAGAFG